MDESHYSQLVALELERKNTAACQRMQLVNDYLNGYRNKLALSSGEIKVDQSHYENLTERMSRGDYNPSKAYT